MPILSEFDLAGWWDDRPVLAITGTDGKTTVTTLVRDMLAGSGLAAEAVGNTEVPAGGGHRATRPPTCSWSRPRRSGSSTPAASRPQVATWLNFAADHLDSHPTLAAYEAAKARIWRDQAPDQVAVGNADDPVVARHLAPGAGPPGAASPPAQRRVGARGHGGRRRAGRPRRGRGRRRRRPAPPAAPRRRPTPSPRWPRRSAAGPRRGRRRRAAGLHGAPPPRGARGRGWRRAVLRRLQGHDAPRGGGRACPASSRS